MQLKCIKTVGILNFALILPLLAEMLPFPRIVTGKEKKTVCSPVYSDTHAISC